MVYLDATFITDKSGTAKKLYVLNRPLNVRGSIINVGVTPLRCHFQPYFFAKNKHTRLTYFTIKVSKS